MPRLRIMLPLIFWVGTAFATQYPPILDLPCDTCTRQTQAPSSSPCNVCTRQYPILAMAYCPANGAVGVHVNPLEHRAAELAIKSCLEARGGLHCCRIYILLKGDYLCGAIAIADDGSGQGETDSIGKGFGRGSTLEEAQEDALRKCGDDCHVIARRCRY